MVQSLHLQNTQRWARVALAVFCELSGRNDYLVMVRTHDWKLVSYLDNGDVGELYDLNADPGELHNLWSNPEQAKIQQTLLDWIRVWHTAQSRGTP